MNIPKDPIMLLSFVNTQLRDNYHGLEELAASYDVSADELTEKLGGVGYHYSAEQNQFVRV